jgi:uncharacterized phage protein (TIGR01671 family)
MNRQIKFRGWHTIAKRMFSAEEMGRDELTLNPDGRGFVNISGTSTRLSQYVNDMTPLQFTGLFDMNGKEIYEGDILKKYWQGNNGNGFLPFKVYYDERVCGFNIANGSSHTYEVIGDIYQNPELLK